MRLIDADALMKYIAVLEESLEDMLDEYPEANHIDSHERTKIYISIEDINTFKEMLEEAPTVERPRGEWISVKDRLPEDNVAVLIWSGRISIAKLEKGITMAEREAMKRGEIDDPESEGWNLYNGWFTVKRSDSIQACDEWGNNLKPYCWEVIGGVGQYFGQDVKYWMPLPQKPDMRGEGL